MQKDTNRSDTNETSRKASSTRETEVITTQEVIFILSRFSTTNHKT
jgi:hypothetical protein